MSRRAGPSPGCACHPPPPPGPIPRLTLPERHRGPVTALVTERESLRAGSHTGLSWPRPGSLCPQQQALQPTPGTPGRCPEPRGGRPGAPSVILALPRVALQGRCPRGRPGRSCHPPPPAPVADTQPCPLLPLARRYQLPSQEEAKERRHSHAAAGLPESDNQSELPPPPALSMSLSAKGQLTNIGQYPRGPPRAQGQGGAGGLGFRLTLGSPTRAGSRRLHSPTPREPEGRAPRGLGLRGGPAAQGVASAASDSLSVGRPCFRPEGGRPPPRVPPSAPGCWGAGGAPAGRRGSAPNRARLAPGAGLREPVLATSFWPLRARGSL